MATLGIARLGVIVKLSEDKSVILNEGDCVTGLRYTYNKKEYTLDGCVRVICARTTGNSNGPTSCPPEPYTQNFITPTQLIIDSSSEHRATLTKVNIADIIDIAATQPAHGDQPLVIGPGSQYRPLGDVLAELEPNSTVTLLAGTFTDPITLTNGVTLVCDNETVLSGAVVLQDSANIVGGTITGAVTINGSLTATAAAATEDVPATITITGTEFTGDSTVVVDNAPRLAIRECYFHNHNLTAKTMLINVKTEHEMLLNLDNNTFGEQNEFSYNLFECRAKLLSGSTVSGNKFQMYCCTHNQINLYGLADAAEIAVSNNWCAFSGNLVRIGFKYAPIGTVIMEKNVCDDTEHGEYGGLFLIQPFGKHTTSFKGVTIHLNGNVVPEGEQIGYLYASGNEVQFTAETSPAIYINGDLVEIPDSSPVPVPMALR